MDTSGNGQMESEQKTQLIDILYKDTYRIDSYIAQLLDGAVRSVKMQDNTSHGSSHTMKGSISVFSANFGKSNLSSALREYSIDPHDHNVISLLSSLDLERLDAAPPTDCIGRLVHLHCRLAIRDFKEFETLIPAMAKNKDLFGTGSAPINEKNIKEFVKIFDFIKKIIPLNIEMECSLDDGTIIRGILKNDYLLMDYRDIVSIYGTVLPGQWNVIGIIDEKQSSAPMSTNQMRGVMDAMAKTAEFLYNDSGEQQFSIAPILIYRELSK